MKQNALPEIVDATLRDYGKGPHIDRGWKRLEQELGPGLLPTPFGAVVGAGPGRGHVRSGPVRRREVFARRRSGAARRGACVRAAARGGPARARATASPPDTRQAEQDDAPARVPAVVTSRCPWSRRSPVAAQRGDGLVHAGSAGGSSGLGAARQSRATFRPPRSALERHGRIRHGVSLRRVRASS